MSHRNSVSKSVAGVLTLAVLTHTAFATNATWISPTSGNWGDPTNWSTNPAIPNAIDDSVTFGPTPTAETVTLNASITLGSVTFDSYFPYTLAPGTGNLSLQSSTGIASILLTNSLTSGTTVISTPIALASNTTVTNNSFAYLNFSGPISGTGSMTINVCASGCFPRRR